MNGRVAVVTGGSGAIGSALARGLVEAGARVAVVARNAGRLDETARSIGNDTIGVAADVRDEPSLVVARDTVLDRFGSLDVLVNCAGGNVPAATLAPDESPFAPSADAYREVMDLNFVGTVIATRVFGLR